MGRRLAIAVGLLLATTPALSASPEELLRNATARIDSFVDHFRRTGERSDVSTLAAAEPDLQAAVRTFADRGDMAGAALATIKLGQIERMQGHWDAAIARYEEAERFALRARHPGHRAKAVTDRALAELSRPDYGAASTHAEAAVTLASPLTDRKLLFDALDVSAQVKMKQGNLNGAAAALNRALALPSLTDDVLFYGRLDRADLYLALAAGCDQQPNFDVCLQALERCQADYREAAAMAKRLGWSGLERQVAEFRQQAEVRKQMIASQQRSQQAIGKAALFHPRVASDVLVTERFAPGGAALPPAMLQLYEESRRFQQAAGGFGETVQATSLHTDALMRQSQGDHAGATTALLKAVDVLERDRRSLRDDAARGTFLEDKTQIYTAAILELLDGQRYAEGFDLMERSRARAMAEMLAARKLDLASAAERQLYASLLRLRSEIATQQAQLFRLINKGAAKAQIAAADAAVAKLEEAQRALEARMAQQSPRLHELTVSKTLALADLQRTMQQERADVLEYLVTDTGLIMWHVGPNAVHVRNVFVPRTELAANIAALRDSIDKGTVAFDHQRAHELYLQLIQPARGWISHNRLVIVPHDVLNALPFAVLEDPINGQALGERCQLTQAPSATIYARLRPWSAREGRRTVAAADPSISEAEDEIATLQAIYGGTFRRLGGHDLVTKAQLKQQVRGMDLVHLSVHGTFDDTEPLLSYLTLAKGPRDDGRLTAAEIFGLPLEKARLVVLSSCESGRVEAGRANEVLGMLRGLLYAGAGALVLSSWKVESASTTLWMQTFYRAAQTATLPEAAQRALLTVKAMPQFSHPYYWAAFSLVARQ